MPKNSNNRNQKMDNQINYIRPNPFQSQKKSQAQKKAASKTHSNKDMIWNFKFFIKLEQSPLLKNGPTNL